MQGGQTLTEVHIIIGESLQQDEIEIGHGKRLTSLYFEQI